MLYNEVLFQYSSTHLYLKISSVVFVRCFYLFGLYIILSEPVVLLTLAITLTHHVSQCPFIWAHYHHHNFIGLLGRLNEIPYIRFIAQYLVFKWLQSFFPFPYYHLLILKMETIWDLLGNSVCMRESVGQWLWGEVACLWEGRWKSVKDHQEQQFSKVLLSGCLYPLKYWWPQRAVVYMEYIYWVKQKYIFII